jgi:D-alanyl-D-alanine carboxypeptidase (penicillin-binding protein 5/6)
LEALLAATLIASANDACRALADHLAGDQARFVKRMNARAKQLGMNNTHFVNACGHDDPLHYASARDLAVLAHELIKHPQALALAGLRSRQISTVDGRRSFALKSTNALLGRYPGILGLKTGRTAKAGNCLVALAQRGSTQVLLVLLKGSDRWWDAVDVLELAFERAAH